MSIFDDIKTGLEQAIEYENGTLKAKKTTISVAPLEKFTSADIKQIRKSTGMTQVLFAEYMGVSKKTVEAWEGGRSIPNGTARRMLSMLKNDPDLPEKCGLLAK